MEDYRHLPVLAAEVLGVLRPKSGGRYVDGTLGGGGHAARILEASSPGGWLYGCDRDEAALEAATVRLGGYAGRIELRRGDFGDLAEWIERGSCDGVLLDLGVSSVQLDRAERGFSFQRDGPLDMRMDRRQSLTAAEVVNTASVAELARIFLGLGEEHEGARLARAIGRERERVPFETTRQLAGLIEGMVPRRGRRVHPATRVFQALRMVVNDELGCLKRGMAGALEILRPGGRLVVITFHSVEDRVVKLFGRRECLDYEVEGEVDVPELRRPREPRMRWVTRKAVKPLAEEVAMNPRARSAQMRVLEKVRGEG
jgi:16S rRNA (cytosine1402-N4)-methyltransferase